MPAVALAAPPAPVTDLRVQRLGTSAVLTWTHTDATIHHYEVWWSDSPYAAIGDAGMVRIATVTPGAAPSEATYTDTASGVGNTAVNSFYAVRGVTAGGEASALSNRAGEFDFGLNGVQPALPVVDHCGTISADEMWGPNAVHRLSCGVAVASGETLTVLPGTVIKLQNTSVGLTVNGSLEVRGSALSRVYFTSLRDDSIAGDTNSDGQATAPAAADWSGITVAPGGSAVLEHAAVRYGGWYSCSYGACSGSPALVADGSSLAMLNSTVEHNGGQAAQGAIVGKTGAAITVTGSTIADNDNGWSEYAGVYVTNASLSINNSTLTRNPRGVYASQPISLNITTSTFRDQSYGIYLDSAASPVVAGNQFSNHSAYPIYIALQDPVQTDL